MARAALLTFLITIGFGAYAANKTISDNRVYNDARDVLRLEKRQFAQWEEDLGVEIDPDDLNEVMVDWNKNVARAHFDAEDRFGCRAIFNVRLAYDQETGAYTWEGLSCTAKAPSRQPMEQMNVPIRFTPSGVAP